ncbi:T6SS effector BTH_I2691 family protein [Citrobacter sedlakii]|uniref:T6SS effector BTH_I2691 family protein n=1 Tax=Citrobacter TaxID=544 RepID=UPI002593998B|nr:T6SS effector BTH_I2691 family protein [Citrobacter sedlakii]MDR5003789.1 T6SS effector BTH_I2691 family protein [Citrobacter sedlakii]
MSQKQGCNFCTRQGLALLPVRPGIKGLNDRAPDFPATFTPPPVMAQGETAYTTRLLREGFLYIRNEMAGSWINYYVTQEGFYYPLPESGNVPPTVVNGKTKPCITEPAELANASLITLPVMPPPYQNGVFWFAWSEVEWTDAVRKQHEDAGYQARYMQRFDLNGWLNGGKAENVVSISALTETVAEYSQGADSCDLRLWSPVYWKKAKALDGANLFQAADALSPGKGGMIMLRDPVAVAQELSALSNYRLETNFSNNPEYKRGLALSSALSGLQDAMCTQFARDLLAQDERLESRTRYGWETTGGIMIPAQPERADDLHELNNSVMETQVGERWAAYEKYIDREQEKAFLKKYDDALLAYDSRIVVPMTEMYLDWMKSGELLDYLDHNFDPEDVASGGLFVQAVTDCIAGMTDKKGASDYFCEQMSLPSVTARNILLRATVMNNTSWMQQINSSVSGGRYDDLPWDKLADGFKDITKGLNTGINLAMETYLSSVSSVLLAVARKSVEGALMPALVALASCSGHALKTVQLTGERKHFVSAVLEQLAELTDVDDRVSKDRLRHYIDIEMRRMKISGVEMNGKQESRFIVMIDIDEAKQLKSLPAAGREKALAKTIHSAEEINESVFPKYWRSKLYQAKGISTNRLAGDAATAVPLAGGVLSVALQWNAVISGGLPKNFENGSKFTANIVSAVGASAEAVDTVWREFRTIRLRGVVRLRYGAGTERFITQTLKVFKWVGTAAGVMAVLWDSWHAVDEFLIKDNGSFSQGVAYLASATGGGILWASAMGWLALGPLGIIICLVLVFGSAIYLASKEKDKIQKWLAAMWWRAIPSDEKNIPAIMPETVEMDSFAKLMDLEGATA